MKQSVLTEGAVAQKLKEFRLAGMAATLELRLKQGIEEDLSPLEILGLLCEDESNVREENKRKRLYKRNRSGCENVTLAIISPHGVPCRHGNTAYMTTRGMGTDPTRSASL